jgi:hypothetical protein
MKLPFPDGTFDLIVCQFGVMFFPDKLASFNESLRVLRAGGTYLFVLWDDYANMSDSLVWIAAQTVGDMLGRDPDTLVKSGLFRRANHHSRGPDGSGISRRESRSDCTNGKSGFSTGCSGDHSARLLAPHRHRNGRPVAPRRGDQGRRAVMFALRRRTGRRGNEGADCHNHKAAMTASPEPMTNGCRRYASASETATDRQNHPIWRPYWSQRDPISDISTINLAVMHKLLCNVVAYDPRQGCP